MSSLKGRFRTCVEVDISVPIAATRAQQQSLGKAETYSNSLNFLISINALICSNVDGEKDGRVKLHIIGLWNYQNFNSHNIQID